MPYFLLLHGGMLVPVAFIVTIGAVVVAGMICETIQNRDDNETKGDKD